MNKAAFNRMAATRLIAGLLLLASSSRCGWTDELSPLAQRGEDLAKFMCVTCHAIGRADASPHPGAPPFRSLDRRLDLDTFMARLRQGLTSGHPDMPTFRFSREDARAFIAYLRSIQTP